MMRSSLVACAIAFAGFLAPAAAQMPAEAPQGRYLVEDGGSQVEFYSCGVAICGRIIWMQKNQDKKGRPLVDENNPDPNMRSTPLLGLTILHDLRPGEERNAYVGEVYNPRDGNRYPVTVTILSDAEISVKGCGFAGFICKTQQWARVANTVNQSMDRPTQ
jgi:uncharacterized protein (DUF2147 family)